MTPPATHRVMLTARVEQDLNAIVGWIAEHDPMAAAAHVLSKLHEACSKLAWQPERGAYAAELLALCIRRYRQVFFKPYRVMYRMVGGQVAVLLIDDGRRNRKAAMERRVLGD